MGRIIRNGEPYTYNEAENISYSNSGSGLTATNTQAAIDELNTKIERTYISATGTITALPYTQAVTGLTSDHECIKMDLGTPSAQASDWTVTTTSGSFTITGTLTTSATTTVSLGFVK